MSSLFREFELPQTLLSSLVIGLAAHGFSERLPAVLNYAAAPNHVLDNLLGNLLGHHFLFWGPSALPGSVFSCFSRGRNLRALNISALAICTS